MSAGAAVPRARSRALPPAARRQRAASRFRPADPHPSTTCGAPRLSGARATFCDLVTNPDLSGIVASEGVVGRDVILAGVALATESAGRRAAAD